MPTLAHGHDSVQKQTKTWLLGAPYHISDFFQIVCSSNSETSNMVSSPQNTQPSV